MVSIQFGLNPQSIMEGKEHPVEEIDLNEDQAYFLARCSKRAPRWGAMIRKGGQYFFFFRKYQ
jgi:hypothetical protein